MKIHKFIKKIIAYGIITITAVAILVFAYGTYMDRKNNNFFIKNANFQFQESDLQKPKLYTTMINGVPTLPVHLHRIIKGQGVILGVREFEKGTHINGITKITIWIPELNSNFYNMEKNQNIKTYFTFGTDDVFDPGCAAQIDNGSIEIIKNNEDTVSLKIKSIIQCKERFSRKVINIDKEYLLNSINYEQLTPWQGIEGDSIRDETTRGFNPFK